MTRKANNLETMISKLDHKQFNKMVDDIQGGSRTLKELIQHAAVWAFLYAYRHNDFDYATRLAIVVRDEISADQFTQLKAWFETCGPFRFTRTKKEDFAELKGFAFRKVKQTEAKYIDFDVDRALETNWFDIKTASSTSENTEDGQTKAKVINANSYAERLARISKDIDKAISGHSVTGSDDKEIKAQEKTLTHMMAEINAIIEKYKTADNKDNVISFKEKFGLNKAA